MVRRYIWTSLCLLLIEGCLAGRGWADAPPALQSQPDLLQPLFDRIQKHAANELWRQDAWRDEQLDAAVNSLLAVIPSKKELPDLRIPEQLMKLPAVNDQRLALGFIDGSLIIGKDARLHGVKRSVVLIDGDALIRSHITDSVVIARGMVSAGAVERSIVIAGAYIQVGIAHSKNPEDGAILVSRGWIDSDASVDHSLIVAPTGGRTQGSGSVFINTELPLAAQPAQFGNRSIIVPQLKLGPVQQNALSTRLELVGVAHGPKKNPGFGGRLPANMVLEPAGLAFRLDGKRYVAELDSEICDQLGNPARPLEGWKLTYVSDTMAVLANGRERAMLRIAGP